MITELQELIIQKYLNNHNILTIIEISENLNDINKLCNYHILISHIIYITIELKFNQENNPHNYKTLNGRELHEYIQKLPNKSIIQKMRYTPIQTPYAIITTINLILNLTNQHTLENILKSVNNSPI